MPCASVSAPVIRGPRVQGSPEPPLGFHCICICTILTCLYRAPTNAIISLHPHLCGKSNTDCLVNDKRIAKIQLLVGEEVNAVSAGCGWEMHNASIGEDLTGGPCSGGGRVRTAMTIGSCVYHKSSNVSTKDSLPGLLESLDFHRNRVWLPEEGG